MATMNISLPEQMKVWVEECVQSGRYANASDYVRDLIRKDHLDQKRPPQAGAIEAGLDRGGKLRPFYGVGY